VVALYKWLKYLEVSLLSLYIARNIDLVKDLGKIMYFLSISILFESVLGITQFIKQSSLFNYLPLGETQFTSGTPQIAKASFSGIMKVLPYGTFPHPNILGGFLALVLPFIIFKAIRIKNSDSCLSRSSRLAGWYGIILLGTGTLLLTRSNSALLAFSIGILGLIWIMQKRRLFLYFFISLLLLFFVFPGNLSRGSLSQRLELNRIAVEMTKENPILGVGLNNFTYRLEDYGSISTSVRLLQPVHNVFLLVSSEMGIPALLTFSLFIGLLLFRLLKAKKLSVISYQLSVALIQLVILGFFDHYLLTIQQGLLLFAVTVGLAFSSINRVKSKQL